MDDRQHAIAAAKQRMANFRLRQTSSLSTATTSIAPTVPLSKPHARSHSRNTSITDFALSNSSTANSLSSEESQEAVTPVPTSPSPRSRPNSHHRRQSSVSTRRESAEMMGVAPPLETGPPAVGDQSELRQLALWALEGKGRSDNAFIGSFNKVQIPELNTLDTEVSLDVTQAPKLKPTLSTFGMGNSLAGKRDSFGKLLISSSNSLKDQLHTLMEEEEEEEEAVEKGDGQDVAKEETPTPSASTDHFCEESSYTRSAGLLPSRPRPANLTLRPLSLRPETLPLSGTEGLPTPSLTPSPRIVGLKALMLAPSPSPSPVPSNSSTSSTSLRRQSLSVSPSPPPQDYTQHRQSISTFNSPAPTVIKRKSSISYKPADSGNHPSGSLPTPGPTPTSPLPPLHAALPPSSASLVPDLDRPLSPTEQAFLFRSHTSLLYRISDLEQAIAGGRGKISSGASTGLPIGMAYGRDEGYNLSKFHQQSITNISMTSEPESLPTPPSDEMLQLVSDLKSERDELMRDADGWRTRVSDLEKQISSLTRRVEAERREAWVVRERLGLVEVEKKRSMEDMERGRLERRRLEKALYSEEAASTKVKEERDFLNNLLKTEQNKRKVAEREVGSLRTEVERLRARAEQADADLQALLVTPKVEVTMQMPVSRRFNSIDSQMSTSSNTDVEEYVPVGIRTRKLNAVQEEIEDRDIPRDVTSECGIDSDNDELAHYEDDEELDDDMMFGDDQTSSSFGSIVRSNSHLLRLDVAGVTPAPLPVHNFVPSHAHSGSMERGWSFPQSRGIPSSAPRGPPQVDNFFECLDALDAAETDDTGILPTYDSVTAKQSWLGAVQSSDDDDDDDEMPPFVLPTQPKEKNWKEIEAAKLSVLTEEDEEEVLFKSPGFPSLHEGQATQQSEIDPVTPRARVSHTLQVPVKTPTKHAKVRKTSADFAIPGFKPYSGSVPILKAPPPPKRISSPIQDTSTTPRVGGTAIVPFKLTSSNVMPQPTYNLQLGFTTPNKPRPSATSPTLIPRLSTSPKSPLAKTIPLMTDTCPKSQGVATTATKLTPPKASMRSMPPVFIPQPKTTSKSVIRSSLLPPQPPMLIAQQTVSPTASSPKQGLTFKLTQQMQSLTSLWSPWSPSSDTVGKTAGSKGDIVFEKPKVTRYISKMRQLERLGRELREDSVLSACEYCAHCSNGVIII